MALESSSEDLCSLYTQTHAIILDGGDCCLGYSREFGKLLSDEHARWGRVVREKGIKES